MTKPKLDLAARFAEYHADNPHVYRQVCRFCDEALSRGRTRLSINLIFERVRWYTRIETTGEEFKMNNSYRAFYARMWLSDHPGHDGFFELRSSVADIPSHPATTGVLL
jgi:hypothetical protein